LYQINYLIRKKNEKNMSFGGPYSEMNKRMQEFREDKRSRREKINQYRESAGISSASSNNPSGKLKFSEKDRQEFLKEQEAERFNSRTKTVVALLLSLAIGFGIVWILFLK
jgi:hypothetical protein